MGEVDVGAVEAVEQLAVAGRAASVFQPMCGTRRACEPAHRAAEEAEPGAALVALLEQELHADADAEHRPAGRRAVSQRLVDAGAREPGGRARDVTDAGDDRERRLAHVLPDRS